MEDVNCIFCDDAKSELYKEENGYRAVRCSRCELVWVTPRPSIDEMKKLYEGQETQIDLSGHLLERDLKSIQAKKCLQLISKYISEGRLLEVGSAAGYFLWEAKKSGFDVQGIDITHQFVEYSRNVLQIPTFEGILRDVPFEDNSFDAVYMRNVLSHLAYPLEEFAIMHRLLRPGGFVIMETGNLAELPADPDVYLELPDHLYHFSEKTIDLLLRKTGFTPVRTHRFTLLSRLAPFAWIERQFAKKVAQSREPKPMWAIPTKLPPSKWHKQIISHLAQFVRYDLGRILPKKGTRATLVIVGKKENS
ncbi:MAG: class I SAM-dependent methyltransferase [Myxococcota bacterium]|nr:class I SAM-dependent methyltransferase [Myxococcota bacterium]